MRTRILLPFLASAILLVGCGPRGARALRLATTTSTYDSGLLQAIIPEFEAAYEVRVDVIAVGTGQAIALGMRGDADVILVHDRVKEESFVAAGHGSARTPVMFNDFILVGPPQDPAGVAGMRRAAEALARIAAAEAAFVSRGDDSGTHSREISLWSEAGLAPGPGQDWYVSIGQGMGETLQFANQQGAYTLTDRGTYLALRGDLANLAVMVGGETLVENADPALLNPYGVIAVSPDVHPEVQSDLAGRFVAWLTSLPTQEAIAAFGLDRFGQPLFYPDSPAWRAAHP
jgi:tungstate transport system substrate-binding protein